MKIINETTLPYKEIGKIIDQIQEEFPAETLYFGKTDSYSVYGGGKKIRITVRYLKKYVEWGFYEED